MRSPAEFAGVLRREQARSDRNTHGFVLLIFEAPDGFPSPAWNASLVDILRSRVRATDELGWLDAQRAGVLLPDTSIEGAEILAEDVRTAMAVPPTCTLCSYPDEADEFPDVFGQPVNHAARRRNGNGRDDDFGSDVQGGSGGPLPELVRHAPRGEVDLLLALERPLWKRVIDVVGSAMLLVLLAPVLLLVAIAIKLDSKGPIFFSQKRAGRGGRPFVFYKFRSMEVGAEARKEELLAQNEQEGPVFKLTNDPRVTRVGRVLRKTSLDELPQLWNVLRGDMSLVGPRPPTLDEVPRYEAWQRRRLLVDGGITGLWQVSGRSQVKWPDYCRLDIRYIEARSLLLDLAILAKTIPAVVSGKGAK